MLLYNRIVSTNFKEENDVVKGQKNTAAKKNISEQLQTVRLPRWEELPDLELYMDQVLSLIRKYLLPYSGFDDNGLTASMVNNYVKAGILPAPVKKLSTLFIYPSGSSITPSI